MSRYTPTLIQAHAHTKSDGTLWLFIHRFSCLFPISPSSAEVLVWNVIIVYPLLFRNHQTHFLLSLLYVRKLFFGRIEQNKYRHAEHTVTCCARQCITSRIHWIGNRVALLALELFSVNALVLRNVNHVPCDCCCVSLSCLENSHNFLKGQ